MSLNPEEFRTPSLAASSKLDINIDDPASYALMHSGLGTLV